MSFNPDAGSISGAADAALSNPANGQLLTYDESTDKWVNASAVVDTVSGLQTALDDKVSTSSLTTELESKADVSHTHTTSDITDLDIPDVEGKLNKKNDIVELTDSTNDRFARVNITDDATPTAEWPDRFAFYFNGTRAGYFNEYGELRARPAKQNTIGFRAMSHISASDDLDFFQASRTNNLDAVLGVSKKYITTKEAIKRNYYTTAPTENHIQRTELNYTIDANSPELHQVYNSGKKVSWLNEWGALRGRNPYTSWTDSLVRATIEAGDFMSSIGNAIEIVDRRPAENVVMYGRRWGTGQLVRNGNLMADTYVMPNGGTPPSNLPAGTVIIELDA